MKSLIQPSEMNIVVGISISEPAEEELVRLGLSELHVRHVFVELVRYVLAAGGSIAYGGDFRAGGYTEALFDLVRTYNPKDLTGPERVFNYLAWPLWTEITGDERASLANVATLISVPAPNGAPENLAERAKRTPPELLWYSLALTEMRKLMTSKIGARVIIGGRVSGQQGLYPGLIEEADLALREGVPLFVAGGVGGCGRLLAKSLCGRSLQELTLQYQQEHTERYDELLNEARAAGLEPDYEELARRFASSGMGNLRNGLNETENQHLADSINIDEIVALILRGLRRIAA